MLFWEISTRVLGSDYKVKESAKSKPKQKAEFPRQQLKKLEQPATKPEQHEDQGENSKPSKPKCYQICPNSSKSNFVVPPCPTLVWYQSRNFASYLHNQEDRLGGN